MVGNNVVTDARMDREGNIPLESLGNYGCFFPWMLRCMATGRKPVHLHRLEQFSPGRGVWMGRVRLDLLTQLFGRRERYSILGNEFPQTVTKASTFNSPSEHSKIDGT